MHAEPMKDVHTPQEMRAEILRLQHSDSLTRNVMVAADIQGASSEDRYTILAYHALRERAILQKFMLDDAMLNPKPRVIPAQATPATPVAPTAA